MRSCFMAVYIVDVAFHRFHVSAPRARFYFLVPLLIGFVCLFAACMFDNLHYLVCFLLCPSSFLLPLYFAVGHSLALTPATPVHQTFPLLMWYSHFLVVLAACPLPEFPVYSAISAFRFSCLRRRLGWYMKKRILEAFAEFRIRRWLIG